MTKDQALNALKNGYMINDIPCRFIDENFRLEAININEYNIIYISNHDKTQDMCNIAVSKDPKLIKHVPDRFKTQEMCDRAVYKDPSVFEY